MVDPHTDDARWNDGEDDGVGELLRQAWGEVPVPEPDRGAGDDVDEATGATLEWMRAAWAAQPVPEARIPHVPRVVRRPSLTPLRTAAAALAAALLGFLGFRMLGDPAVAPSTTGGELAAGPESVEGPPAGAEAKLVPERPVVTVASLRPDRMELRSGTVRLILLTGEPSTDPLPGSPDVSESTDSTPPDDPAPGGELGEPSDLRPEGNR